MKPTVGPPTRGANRCRPRPRPDLSHPCTSCIGCIRDSARLGRCTFWHTGGSRYSRGVGSLACPLQVGPVGDGESWWASARTRSPSGLLSSSYAAAGAASEVRDGGVGPLDVIAIFAAGLALQVVLAFRVLAPHPFVVHVELAKQALARAGCGDGHDDLPRSMDRISACHADSPSVRNLPRERSTRFTETALLPSGGRPRTRWATRTRFGDGLDGHYAISALTQPRKTTGHRAS